MARKSKEVQEEVELIEQDNLTASSLSEVDHVNQVEASTSALSKCGGALRVARENQSLTVHEIASRLRLSPKQIEAIEADNFAILPEPTIVRGFIRNYAKQLKIDAQPLLDAYVVIVPSAAPHEMAVKPTSDMKMSSHEKSKSGSYALAALALLLGLGVWLFYQHYVEKPSPTQPTASVGGATESAAGEAATSIPADAALPEAALPAAERVAEPASTDVPTSTALTLPAANLPATGLPTAGSTTTGLPVNSSPATNLPVTNLAAPAVAAKPAPGNVPSASISGVQLPNSQLTASTTLSASASVLEPAAEPPLASNRKDATKLEFNATQETWVSVLDANGREVYSKTIFAGSRESIDVKPPVNVTIGNAGGTSMSMNGKPVELAPHSRNNVAHIKLSN